MEARGKSSSGALSAGFLKYIAAAAMLIDHIAWQFPITEIGAQAAHFFGRLTMPIMCFFLAEGFLHTRSITKYAARIFIFALISQPAFMFAGFQSLNVLFTLFLGLIALWVCESGTQTAISILVSAAAIGLSLICDWPIFGILYILIFGLRRKDMRITRRARLICYVIVSLASVVSAAHMLADMWIYSAFQLGTLFAPVFICFYNGERGRGGSFSKWFFYVFYPLHLVILGFIFRPVF